MSATRTSESGLSAATIFKRHIALPQDHGSWAFIISPLLIGVFAAGTFNASTMLLVVAALGAFLLRQPATIIVKIHSSRRSRAELPAAIFWFAAYSMVIAAACAGLATAGYAPLFWLGVPGVAIFAGHLHLVSRRSERKQAGVEIVAAGALALAAPASYWVGLGRYDPLGWWLWGLNWLQAASSIVYILPSPGPAGAERVPVGAYPLAYGIPGRTLCWLQPPADACRRGHRVVAPAHLAPLSIAVG